MSAKRCGESRRPAEPFLQCPHSPTRPPLPFLAISSSSRAMASSSSSASYPASGNDTLGDVTTASSSDLLLGSFDPAKLHPLAGIDDKLDYLLLDDDKTTDMPGAGTAIPSRGWSDDLCYGTGTMYLSGPYALSGFSRPRPSLPSSSLRKYGPP